MASSRSTTTATEPSRRVVLAGAAAWLAGCGLRAGPEALLAPPGPVVLGWRWVPGAELSYRCEVERVADGTRVRRLEAWTYLVRDLDPDGVATLEGRLVGFGAQVDRDGVRVPEADLQGAAEAEVRVAPEALLRLGMDGVLERCRPDAFAPSWPHRALALRLPERPMVVHDEWPDPELVRPFADLVPLSMEVRVQGRTRLASLVSDSGASLATLTSAGEVSTAGGLTIRVQGSGTWDADRGALLDRSLRAWTEPRGGVGGPGRLEVRLTRA